MCKLQINVQKCFQASNSILGKVEGKDFCHLISSMIDQFCTPVLLYGLKDLRNKPSSIKAIDFVYNSVFVELFNTKYNYNILYCKRVAVYWLLASLSCVPFSFFRTLRYNTGSLLASMRFRLCSDVSFDALLQTYNVTSNLKTSGTALVSKI